MDTLSMCGTKQDKYHSLPGFVAILFHLVDKWTPLDGALLDLGLNEMMESTKNKYQ